MKRVGWLFGIFLGVVFDVVVDDGFKYGYEVVEGVCLEFCSFLWFIKEKIKRVNNVKVVGWLLFCCFYLGF